MKRPHIKQVLTNDGTTWLSWCGHTIWQHEWAFISLDHAILSEENLSTVGIPCTKCLQAARERLGKILEGEKQ